MGILKKKTNRDIGISVRFLHILLHGLLSQEGFRGPAARTAWRHPRLLQRHKARSPCRPALCYLLLFLSYAKRLFIVCKVCP